VNRRFRILRAFLFFALLAVLAPRTARADATESNDVPNGEALRRHRFALSPYASYAFLSGSLSHDAIGASLEWFVLDWLALGLEAELFQPLNASPGAPSPARWPMNETSWGAGGRATFVLLRGLAGAPRPDVYVFGGAGAISTRVVSEIDPANRSFTFASKFALRAGLGVRFYLGSAFALGFELADTVYNEHFESRDIAPPATPSRSKLTAQDPNTWFNEQGLTSMLEARVGFTILFPAP
jgi:hypothetical protein